MYPPGYPPTNYPVGYPPTGYGFPPRSAIPKVVGILAIIFSAFGLFGSVIWTVGPLSDIHMWDVGSELSQMTTWMYLWMVLSIGLFVVHLIGGIFAIQYKPGGLRLLGIYATSAIVLVVVDIILDFALVAHLEGHRGREIQFSVSTMRIIFEGMAAPWPIIVLALTKSRRAKQACGLVAD